MSDRVTQEDFNELIAEFNEASVEILVEKGDEYATDADRLLNFRTVGEMIDSSPEEVAMMYLLKHIQRLAKAVQEGEESYEWAWRHDDGSEALKQRVTDSINSIPAGSFRIFGVTRMNTLKPNVETSKPSHKPKLMGAGVDTKSLSRAKRLANRSCVKSSRFGKVGELFRARLTRKL